MKLHSFGENIWVGTCLFKMMGMPTKSRMTVVRLGESRMMWVHSPIRLTEDIKKELDALGEVAYVIAPNRYHHVFVPSYKKAYPNAQVFSAPGLDNKKKDFTFDGQLNEQPESAWAGDIAQHVIQGIPKLGEVVFFHKLTRTLILTDLAFNIQRVPGNFFAAMLLKFYGAYGRFGPTRVIRWLIKDKPAFRKSLEHMLEWPIERIIVSHGVPIEAEGAQQLKQAFSQYLT